MECLPFAKDHVRRCMAMWQSNGLNHLWCEDHCYSVGEDCVCVCVNTVAVLELRNTIHCVCVCVRACVCGLILGRNYV